MHRDVAQKAEDALRALAGAGDQSERVKQALARLHSIREVDSLETPDHIQQVLQDCVDLDPRGESGAAVEWISQAISAILQEWGAQNSPYTLS